jgi:hypothetical protein
MKKIFIFSIATFSMLACTKERTCTCTTNSTLAGSSESKRTTTESNVRKRDFRLNNNCYDKVTVVEASTFTVAQTITTKCKLK